MNVYAITDTNDEFLMFQTQNQLFAHENSLATADQYTQKVVAYRIGSEVYAAREVKMSYDFAKTKLNHVSLGVRSAADIYLRQLRLMKAGKIQKLRLIAARQRFINELDNSEN